MGMRAWIVAALALSACSGDAPTSFGLEERVIVEGLTFPTGLSSPGPMDAVEAFPQLTFQEPMVLTHAGDGSGRVFVAERRGVVRVFDGDPGASATSVFLDVSAQVLTGGERGLLGLAFDPDHAVNGHVYVRYSTTTSTPGFDHRDVLVRFTVMASDPDQVDPGSALELLAFDQPFSNHNGGAIAFGADDRLYVAVGDGGGQHDPDDLAQDLGSLFGKILRLEADGSVPADNPFVGQPGARGEIWAFGFRNPWRFSFDRSTGELWCGDVGQNSIEEVDRVVAGGNYGWDLFEGTLTHQNPGNVPFAATLAPVWQYDHSLGSSVTGGYVYRGAALPSLAGTYVYGDFVSGNVWSLVHDGVQAVDNVLLANVPNPASFGEDEAGELYVCCFDGRIRRFEENGGGGAPPFPQTLSATGLFSDVANLVPTPGLIEYGVQVELWSDGARKRRWMALPGLSQIFFHPTEAWSFPVGTVLVKHFELDVAPGIVERLETRVLLHTVAGWEGYTYRWNDAGNEAHLLAGGESEVISVAGPAGDYDLSWNYPSRADCLTCHTAPAGRVLGVRTRQLNGDFAYPSQVDNQLQAWNHVGLFFHDLGAPQAYEAFASLADEGAPLGERARALLDVNCAQCHRQGGTTPVDLDLRYGIPTGGMNAVLVAPSAGDLGLPNAFLLAPGSKETSVLWERMRLLDSNRMPPLGSTLVDDAGLELVGRWIDEEL